MSFQPDDLLIRLDAKAALQYVNVNGNQRIAFRRFGQGLPVVLLHGGHGNWKHWAANIEALAEEFEVWLPDMPGFSDSDDPESGSIETLVHSLKEAIDELLGATTEIRLAGFSFGGYVAALLAAERPVRSLVLLGTAGHGGERRDYATMMNWRAKRTDNAQRQALRHNLAAFMLADPSSISETALAIYEDACVRTRFRSKGLPETQRLLASLDASTAPTLFIWGAADVTATAPETFFDTLHGKQKRSFKKLAGAGHWVQWERASEVNALLLDWFAE